MKEPITLDTIHESLNKLMYLEDNGKALDLLLATYLSRKQQHSKLWIIFVADTGYGKSELTKPFDNKNIIRIRKMTPATLVAGRNDNGKHDLALKLQNKILLITDMAQILKLQTETKSQLFSQFVDLYDGIASSNAYGVQKYYTDLNVTFIGCSTYAIYNQLLLFSYLGTRFMCYNMKIHDRNKLSNKIKENINSGEKETLRKQYKNQVLTYLDTLSYKHITIPDNILAEIITWADTLTRLRITGNTENTSGELTEIPHEEMPTRIIEQLLTTYRCLKCLSKDYPDERAMSIIKNIVLSSVNRLRMKIIIEAILQEKTSQKSFSRKQLSQKINMGYKQVYKELNFLHHSNLIIKETKYIGENHLTGDEIYYNTWKINTKNKCIQLLIKHLGVE